ncbi:hypothetical protein ACCO45_001765 [Purpureocillium lilacinum]|uniref:Uncharacterized protein n=1 Tax=Purpureocillium lilacinum TaxID=33203 RepID=A0ACC4E8G8_PURLI
MSTSPPQVSVSPMSMVDLDQTVFLPAASSSLPQQTEHLDSSTFATTTGVDFAQSDAFMTPQQYLFPQTDAAEFTQQELNAEFFPGLDQANAGPSSALNPSQTFRPNPIQEWEPSNQQVGEGQVISFEEFIPSPQDFSISSASPGSSSSKSPAIKAESPSGKLPTSTRKVKAGKVEKNKKPEQSGKFVIMTPTPLANDTKESALQVRRLGACFCCHSRKVKCDKERPCKHCKRLMLHVPQLVCWQFQDFLTTLFPDFIRGHFRKDEMSKFLRDNVEGFHVGGVEQPCDIELFSGHRFSATMPIRAKFFTAKTCDVLQHWHLNLDKARLDIQANDSAPIGLEFGTGTQREELRKRAKSYIQEIVNEPQYAEQVTDSFRSTRLPTKVLRIVQQYAQQSDSTMVKRALSIYAMQYVMTRHLCITRQSIVSLHGSGLVPQNTPWVTPRVLARQVKSLIDELIMREMQLLFECFSKSLKPKHKREWAPCMASFLVLCLFMEAVETTTENFAMSQNEINLRNSTPPEYKPEFALNMCKELENMPFKQFAYQFHNIYQTHTKDANTKSFNPLFDDECMEQEEVDGPAVEMLGALRGLLHGEDWQEIQFLADDDILLSRDVHTAPIDASFLYTGRLVAKFLLSFANEQVIFGSSI